MWSYDQLDGVIYHDGRFVAQGYSGSGEGRNNPSKEAVPGVGPIPRGKYKIGKSYKHKDLGPIVMNLDPVGHDALGRSLFRIHGDNLTHTASHGCIILQRPIREEIAQSGDTELTVV